MNRDIVIALAREAGCKPFRSPKHWDDVQVFATPDVLERFAALVAAHERERCAKVCENLEIPKTIYGAHPDYLTGKHMAVSQCAAAIRERMK